MYQLKKYNYVLFGNPIQHSKSPIIHNLFAKQTRIKHLYKAINVPLNQFSSKVLEFFKDDTIQGANVTSPFKEEAYFISHKLTKRAEIAKSVNTLKKINNKYILGDNTDGIGLLSDLIRLKFIKKNFSVLIIGAGGAVKGVLFSILSLGCSVFILNRTVSHAENLVKQFKKYGKIYVFNDYFLKNKCFDLIINAVSRNIEYKNFIPLSIIKPKTFLYDINYGMANFSFLNLGIKIDSQFVADGIGMLVFQAAYSFLKWHNIFPNTDYIIDFLSKNVNK